MLWQRVYLPELLLQRSGETLRLTKAMRALDSKYKSVDIAKLALRMDDFSSNLLRATVSVACFEH